MSLEQTPAACSEETDFNTSKLSITVAFSGGSNHDNTDVGITFLEVKLVQ